MASQISVWQAGGHRGALPLNMTERYMRLSSVPSIGAQRSRRRGEGRERASHVEPRLATSTIRVDQFNSAGSQDHQCSTSKNLTRIEAHTPRKLNGRKAKKTAVVADDGKSREERKRSRAQRCVREQV